MALITTKDLVKRLNEQDPEGDKVLFFRIYDEDDSDEVVAWGDVDEIEVTLKCKAQTSEGAKDILRMGLKLSFQ